MRTALQGWEDELDKRVIRKLEEKFGQPLAFFRRVQGPAQGKDGYWHVRIHAHLGVAFVRQDSMGDLILYGPVTSTILD